MSSLMKKFRATNVGHIVTPWLWAAGALTGLGASVGVGLAGYAFYREPLDVRLEHLQVRLTHGAGRLPAQGLRILHLSDFHFQGTVWREEAKIERVRRLTAHLDYDLLIHTGDFLHYNSGIHHVLTLMDVLPPPRLGAYAVLGNHDYATYNMRKALPYTWHNFLAREARYKRANPLTYASSRRARYARYLRFGLHLFFNRIDGERTGTNDVARLRYELEQRGVHWLLNDSQRLGGPAHPYDLYLAGIDDLIEGHPDLGAALRGVPANAPLILLSHNPDVLQSPAVLRADLLLAGHTHGGQIVLPWLGAAHTQSDYLSRKEASGYFRRGKTHVYINRGLGEGIPLRLGAPPQVTLITLTSDS